MMKQAKIITPRLYRYTKLSFMLSPLIGKALQSVALDCSCIPPLCASLSTVGGAGKGRQKNCIRQGRALNRVESTAFVLESEALI